MPEQEVAVFVEEKNIESGTETGVDFGFTSAGNAVTKTITVVNSGYDFLTVSSLSVPEGFTLVGDFPSGISPNSTNFFQVRLNADTSGIYTGTISFNTNDADENPFSFPVFGNVTCVQEILLELTTDNYGEETTWVLTDAQDKVLYSDGPYTSGQIFSHPMMLPAGDYVFTLYDDYGDGICCDWGSGSYSLKNETIGDVYIEGGGVFGYQETTPLNIKINKTGDIDGNCLVELPDAILALQLISGISPDISSLSVDADVNRNGKIGLEESIYVIETVAGLRE